MTEATALEELVDHLTSWCVTEQQRSSQDLMLMAHVVTEGGHHLVIGFPQGMSPTLRASFGAVVRRAVRRAAGARDRAALLAVAHTAWMSTRFDVPPSENPAREEVLVIYGVNRQRERLLHAYKLLRFGDEIRLRPLDKIRVMPPDESGYSPTFDQVFNDEAEA
jgi:hypothetical protein